MTAYLIITIVSLAPQTQQENQEKREAAPIVFAGDAQRVYREPRIFSRAMRVAKGTPLELAGEPVGRWQSVAFDATNAGGGIERQTGWTVFAPERRSAGELADVLGPSMAESVTLTVKGFRNFADVYRRAEPDKERRLEAIRNATLGVQDVADFARSGGLKLSAR